MARSACVVASGLVLSVLMNDYSHGETVLYAITLDGKLLTLDESTGAGSVVLQLPSEFSGFDSLEYHAGKFYATYEGGARLLRFGFVDGDVVDLGGMGVLFVEGITRRSDGTLFVAASTSGMAPGAESIGQLDPVTGQVSSLVPMTSALSTDVDAIGFDGADTLWGLNYQDPAIFQVDPLSGVVSGVVTLSNGYAGLAIKADSGTFFAVDFVDSRLFKVTASGTQMLVGSINFSGPTGLTFGPEAGDIPTVGEWGVIVMGLLTLAGGTLVFARRRAPAR